jgi:predicted nucleic acid-binding protein
LIDTDVFVDYLRGYPAAVSYLEGLVDPPLISSITVAELYAGVREGSERAALESLVAALNVVALDAAVGVRGGLYARDYSRSHGVGLADALIAASAQAQAATLVTLNRKHFPALTDVVVPYQRA